MLLFQPMNSASFAFRRATLATSFCFAGSLFGQAVATPTPSTPSQAPGQESVVELSPFVISENSETGWIATETLAGSRLRTNF